MCKGKPLPLAETTESVQGSAAKLLPDRSPVLHCPPSWRVLLFWTLLLAGAAHSTTHNSPALHKLQTGCDSRTTSLMADPRLTCQLRFATCNYMDVLPTSIRLPPELRDELVRRAEADDRSLASYIVRVLRAHVESTPEPRASKSRKA